MHTHTYSHTHICIYSKSEDPHTAGMPVRTVEQSIKKSGGGDNEYDKNNKQDNFRDKNKIDKNKKIIKSNEGYEGNVFVDEISIESESLLQSFEDLKKEYTKNKKLKKENEKIVRINENTNFKNSNFSPHREPILIGNVENYDLCDYWRVMGSLDENKKRAKNVVELFLPSVKKLRKLIRESHYSEVQDLCAIFSLKSADHGLHRLNCWYCTLQEVTGIVISHLLNINPRDPSAPHVLNAPHPLSTSIENSGKKFFLYLCIFICT